LDDAGFLQLFQALGKKRRRNTRNAAPEIVEPRAPRYQFAQDERRPAGTEYLGSHSHWAELPVALGHIHGKSSLMTKSAPGRPVQIVQLRAATRLRSHMR